MEKLKDKIAVAIIWPFVPMFIVRMLSCQNFQSKTSQRNCVFSFYVFLFSFSSRDNLRFPGFKNAQGKRETTRVCPVLFVLQQPARRETPAWWLLHAPLSRVSSEFTSVIGPLTVFRILVQAVAHPGRILPVSAICPSRFLFCMVFFVQKKKYMQADTRYAQSRDGMRKCACSMQKDTDTNRKKLITQQWHAKSRETGTPITRNLADG